jgi:small subunit ribosomal protein S13
VARIAGVNIPSQKPIWIALTYIFGIGQTTSRRILNDVQIPLDRRTAELTEAELSRIREKIDR